MVPRDALVVDVCFLCADVVAAEKCTAWSGNCTSNKANKYRYKEIAKVHTEEGAEIDCTSCQTEC